MWSLQACGTADDMGREGRLHSYSVICQCVAGPVVMQVLWLQKRLSYQGRGACLFGICCLQEHAGALKVVKVEHDPNKSLVEKYKVCSQLNAGGQHLYCQAVVGGHNSAQNQVVFMF